MGRSSSHAWPADRTRTVRPPSDGCCTAWRSTAGAALTPARLQQLSCLASRLDAHSAPALCWLLHCLQVSCRCSSYTGTAAAALMPGQQIGRARCARPLMAAALPGDQQQASAPHRHGRSSPHAWPADQTRTVRPRSDGCCAAWRSTAGAALTPVRLQQLSCLASRSDAHGAPALCWLLRCLEINCRRSSYTGTAAATLLPGQRAGYQAHPRSGCSNAACRSAAGVSSTPARPLRSSCLASRLDAHGAPAL